MSVPRWLATLPLSLAVHAAVVVGAVALLRTEPTPPALMIDLDAIIAGRDDGPGGGPSTSGGGVAGTPALRAQPVAPSRSAASPAPTSAPSQALPRPEALPQRAADPLPAATPEPSPTPSPTAPPAPSPAAPSQLAPPSTPSSPTDGRTAASGAPGGGSVDDALHAQGTTSAQGAGRGTGGGGNALVATVAPGTGAGLGDGVGSEYAAYLARVRQRIQESLRYPAAARRRGVSGTVQLEIAIAPDGAISTVSVNASSSHDVLDRAAMEAARSVPRVPFPPDVRPRPLRVRLPVVFELQ